MKTYHAVLTLITEAAIDHIIAGLVHLGYSVALHAKDVSAVSVVVVLTLQREKPLEPQAVAGEIRQFIVDRGIVLLSHVVYGVNPAFLDWGGAIVPKKMLKKLTPPAEITEKNTPLSRMANILKDDDP
jgi:hypothetical protein